MSNAECIYKMTMKKKYLRKDVNIFMINKILRCEALYRTFHSQELDNDASILLIGTGIFPRS